ncbi:hypothetical protein EF847_06885 [Actinobacteria bacterium YIM 96077]|uniref:Alpha/beta-hydrolase catalytic domain-containing protein n=2 Tax=Phytoactinopolyspora halophila TaxID=1981511 RepID=A0A329QA92_9ACTN|nr:hypothetical protein EF847_06885 [Actinobacteria bacterium YIM 96077]RAW09330.1 hypothetical protein DPM12_21705 [Phytoactinopolyspora halophila]
MAGGVVAFFLSLLPSLIPRPWLVQALFSGITVALGYGIGVAIAWLARRSGVHPEWSARTRRLGWWALAASGAVAIVGGMLLGAAWQGELRQRFGMPGVEPVFVAVAPGAAVVAVLAVVLARGARWLVRRGVGQLKHWLPERAVNVAGIAVAVVAAVLVFNGTIGEWLVTGMNRLAHVVEKNQNAGIERPAHAERSGSAVSAVPWESLSLQGREFVAGGPSLAELEAFASRSDALDSADIRLPIRVYAGLDSAGDLTSAAELVVDELDRTDAWNREVLVVVTPTSSGHVEPVAAEAIEMMHGGDTAIAAMQYSNVSSWLSFLSDQDTISEAGRIVFETIYAAWTEQPVEQRPLLLVQGESLGSYGGQSAFSGLQDMVARTDGALWVATPNSTKVARDLVRYRDPRSLERRPIVDDGRQVRWSTGKSGKDAKNDVWDLGPDWDHPRVLYLQHASDAVVWWSPELVLHRPDWLREPRAPDVLDEIRWLPFVTFWLVTMDMFVAGEVPAGFGHVYVQEYADAWAAVAAPDEWTDEDTQALRELLGERFDR